MTDLILSADYHLCVLRHRLRHRIGQWRVRRAHRKQLERVKCRCELVKHALGAAQTAPQYVREQIFDALKIGFERRRMSSRQWALQLREDIDHIASQGLPYEECFV